MKEALRISFERIYFWPLDQGFNTSGIHSKRLEENRKLSDLLCDIGINYLTFCHFAVSGFWTKI